MLVTGGLISWLTLPNIAVSDIERSFLFYKDILGFKPLCKSEGSAYFLAGNPDDPRCLWFSLDLDRSSLRRPSPCNTHFAFSVNDGAFEVFTEKSTKADNVLFLEQGKPLVFGATNNKGIKLDGLKPVIVDLEEGASTDDLWIHDEKDFYKAQILIRMFDDPRVEGHFPRPFGVFYETDRPCYEDDMAMQIEDAIATKGKGNLDKLLRGREVWEIAE